MAKVIIYQNSEGIASIVYPLNPNKSIEDIAKRTVPDGTAYEIVEDSQLPSDKTFRDAWVKGSGVVTEDVTKAKVIAHKTRREKREAEFKPHDDTISLNIPGTDTSAVGRGICISITGISNFGLGGGSVVFSSAFCVPAGRSKSAGGITIGL